MTSVRLSKGLRAGAAALLVAAAPLAQAAMSFDYRVSVYNVTFSDLTFANANARYDFHVDISGNDGDTWAGMPASVRTGQSNFSWTAGNYSASSDAFVGVSNVVDPGTTGTATADVALSGGTRGAIDIGYDTAAGTLGPSFIQRNSGPGGYSLDFSGGGNGFLGTGNLFVLVVFVQGDWTGAQGTGPGQLEFIGLNPAFAIGDNFSTYNSVLNATIFTASGTADGSTGFGPDLRFRLHGDALPVPEPAPGAMLAAGLGALMLLRRRIASGRHGG